MRVSARARVPHCGVQLPQPLRRDRCDCGGKFLIFAEVKLRKSAEYGAAREFVDARKQERLRQTALLWLEGHETRLQPRFDVIEIYAPDGMATKQPVIRQLEDAF